MSGVTMYYGGGGGGSRAFDPTSTATSSGLGGVGGGGNAGQSGGAKGSDGTPNTGGGGGGGANNTTNNGGAGGSGIVIVRYPIATTVLTKLPPALNSLEASPTGAYALRKLSTYSGPTVRIEPHPITSWPPAALTGASTTLTGHGTYVVSASQVETGNASWRAFDFSTNTYYEPSAATFVYSVGEYVATATTTTNISGTQRRGEWIQIRLATKVTLRTYNIVGRQDGNGWERRAPTTFWIAGSNDQGITWSLVDSRSNLTYPQAGLTFTVTNPVAYETYRMVISVIGNSGSDAASRIIINISTWQLNGDSATPLNTAQDFYADEKGNLAVAPIVGQTLSRALGTNTTGYVTKWYDQSGQGRDLLPVGTVTMAGLDSIDFGGSGSFFDTSAVTGAATAYANVVSGRRLREVLFFDVPALTAPDRALVSAPTLFGSLSAAATSSAVGAFALRRLNPAYTGPVVQVQAHPTVPWPPVAMTGASTNVAAGAYGVGAYEVLTSSEIGGMGVAGWRAFDKTSSNWSSSATDYTNGVANATTVTAATYQGAWLQIKLPAAVTVTSYTLCPGTSFAAKSPGKWYVLGSANGTDWTLIDTRQDLAVWASATEVRTFTLAARPQAFLYHRIVVNQLSATTGTLAELGEWVLFGDSATYAPTTKPITNLYADEKGNLALTPAIGQPLADWLGTDVGYVKTWYDQSGKGNHAEQDSAALQPVIQRATKGAGYMCQFFATQYLVGMSYTVLKDTNYSFSVVERRQTSRDDNYFISSGNAGNNQFLAVGYRFSTRFRFGQFANDLDITPYPAYNTSNEPLHYWAGTQSSTSGRVIYDQLLNTVTPDSARTALLGSTSGNLKIGSSFGTWIGEIYEVIMFTSALDSTTVTQISDNQKVAFN
jgi:hypothetical protein